MTFYSIVTICRGLTTKPDKAQLVAELERNLSPVDHQFNQDNLQSNLCFGGLFVQSTILQSPVTFPNFGEVTKTFSGVPIEFVHPWK